MKETVLDVLMYLFDNYLDDEYEMESDQDVLRSELIGAGFQAGQVDRAFDWLEGLSAEKENLGPGSTPSGKAAIRLFADKEMERLDSGCRGFILFLEQAGILDPEDRELVIDQVMALDSDEVDLPQLKWIVLMVLLNQPQSRRDVGWMENVVMDEIQSGLH